MKQPFWILNGALLCVLIGVLCFIFFSKQKKQYIAPIEVPEEVMLPARQAIHVDIKKIYENDLFDTYVPPLVQPPISAPTKKPLPTPPTPQPVKIPAPVALKFAEPLPIVLTGIIISDDASQSVAMIKETKTSGGGTLNYRVGDKIEDAQLIRIMKNKIILVRSNSQQEIIYINPRDIEFDRQLVTQDHWSSIIKKNTTGDYVINVPDFIYYIPSIGQFIDALNLSTVYNKGESVGCRVGKLAPHTVGYALGLQPGDIISEINEIPTALTASRMKIYESIVGSQNHEKITVALIRKQQQLTLQYVLEFNDLAQTMTHKNSSQEPSSPPLNSPENANILMQQVLDEKRNYQSAHQTIQKHDKNNMFAHAGKKGKRAQNVLLNNAKQEL